MITGIEDIRKNALRLGACAKAKELGSIKEAVDLLLTPQGREFAMKTCFPDLATWRENPYEVDNTEMVLLDMGSDNYAENEDCIAVGNTTLEILFDNPDRLYHVMAMHGAKIIIKARNYAVVTVTNVRGKIRVINEDGTAVITEEKA